MPSKREQERTITEELKNYPVTYQLGQTGGKHPYAAITLPSGKIEKLSYSGAANHANFRTLVYLKTQIRRLMRQNGVEPRPEYRSATKIGAIGEKIMELIDKKDPPRILPDVRQQSQPKALTKTTDDKPERKNKMFSHSEVASVVLLVLKNADVDIEAQNVTYNAGWDDTRIAEILKAAAGREFIDADMVKKLRREQVGLLKSERVIRDSENLKASPRRLLGEIRKVAEQVAALEARMNARFEAVEGAVLGTSSPLETAAHVRNGARA